MVHRIAQQMRQRRFESLENVAVHLGIFASHFQARFLPKRAGQITHHARKTSDTFAERTHPGS